MHTLLSRPAGPHGTRPAAAPPAARRLLKVPQVTALFWVVKILTTGVGESASDALAVKSLLVPAVIGAIGLTVALWHQFRAHRYEAPTYWFTVAMVAVFGTVGADMFNPQAGGPFNVPVPITAGAYALALAACLTLWRRTERTLSVHAITTARRERFYWATVLLTFGLGTALGDLCAFYLNLGFATSIAVFSAAIAVPLTLWRLGANPTATFWTAYILTRPLGASIADELGKAHPLGLGVGDGRVTILGCVLIAALVTHLRRARADDPQRGAELGSSGGLSCVAQDGTIV